MNSRESFDEKGDVKTRQEELVSAADVHAHLAFKQDQVDTAATLVAGESIQLDAAEGLRIRRKIDKHILPMMCSKWRNSHDEHHFTLSGCVSVILDSVYR